MPRQNTTLQTFNRGKVSPRALARTDLNRTRLSAEVQTNYVPRVLGSMMLRPGLGYIGGTLNNKKAFHVDFVAALNDTAILELTDSNMRVRINESILQRAAVSTMFTNNDFGADLTGWTDSDQAGATSQWVTGGYLGLTGTGFNKALRTQLLHVAAPDIGVEHAIRIIVLRGRVSLRVGSSSGDDDYLGSVDLFPGTHSLTFTPTTDSAYVELSAFTTYQSLVDSCSIEVAGDMIVPTTWVEADLPNLRYIQSVDVVFVACSGKKQQRITRYNNHTSWSIEDYVTEDGPFRTENISNITLSPGALTGDTTLTASQKYFKASNVGSLFSVTSIGQNVTQSLNGDGQFTSEIKVIGVGSTRNFSITITGTWAGTLTVQRSVGAPGAEADTSTTFTGNTVSTFNDGLDNQIIYYRIGFKTGGYVSGTAIVNLTYASGGLTGIARITEYTSATSVNITVLTPFGATTASTVWSEGEWSNRRGFPSATCLYEGRLWWAGKDKIWGSISDAFASYDDTVEGDSGTISRSIGSGPLDTINWLLPLQRMIVGAQNQELSVRSSSFDEILTPSNFNLKIAGTQGSANVAAAIMDSGGIYIQRGGSKAFQLVYDPNIYDYTTKELTTLNPDQLLAGVTKIGIQRKIDTRLHCTMGDGSVSLLIFDRVEDVTCWIDIVTDGVIEDVVIIPADPEDAIYYTVARNIGGVTMRYFEKWALETEAQGGTVNKMADSFIVYNGVPTSTITGLSTLEGKAVVIWADGVDAGTATVVGGQITLAIPASYVVVGLYYKGQFKSAKLPYAASGGTALNMNKRNPQIGFIMINTHRFGVTFGGDFDHLDPLPGEEDGENLDDNLIWDSYDEPTIPFNGDWGTDTRVCLESESPKPANILAITFTTETNG